MKILRIMLIALTGFLALTGMAGGFGLLAAFVRLKGREGETP